MFAIWGNSAIRVCLPYAGTQGHVADRLKSSVFCQTPERHDEDLGGMPFPIKGRVRCASSL